MTPKEAADRAGVTVQAVYYWIHHKMVKATRTGTGRYKIDEASLEALLAEQPVD